MRTEQAESQILAKRPVAVITSADVESRSRPVLVWAALGALFIAFNVYLYLSWFLSGDAKRVSTGPTPVPGYAKVVVHGWEAFFCISLVLLVYRWVIRPWRRDGHIGFDGLFLLSFLTIFWQDVLINYGQVAFLYNAEFVNLGSWYRHVPGWLSPNGNQVPEPLLGMFTLYGPFFFLAAVAGCWWMRKCKARWPRLRAVALFGMGTAFFVAFVIVFEIACMRFGYLWAYPGAARSGVLGWFTLFKGTHYQYPVYVEGLLAGAVMATFALVRYHKNDKGQSWAERGINEVRVSPRARTGLRFLALCGIVNVIYLVTYMVPWNVFSLNSDSWPRSIADKSFLVGGNRCGPTTTYACPGPGVPIPRPDSVHIGPTGELVVPSGTKRPGQP